jgi:glycine cleavage system aminomethyltransferase T/glycine/D-amino acid oxidase-like deaminating enzyme
MAADLPSHARAVIIGGGVIGCSVAYHLAKLGWQDVVLLERKQLTCGTTWHAAGLIGQLRATPNLTRLAKYSAELYLGLEAETGQPTGFKQNGSIGLARTEARLIELKRQAAMGRACGLEVHELTPLEARELYPLIETSDLAGAIHIPADGQANPIDIAQALAKGARRNGARIVEGCMVTGVARANGRVTGVETERGPIRAEVVVNCAGMWGREVGRMAGASVPLHACEHFYVLTEPMPEVPPHLPVLRDPDGCLYVKEDAGKLLVGVFEPLAKPWGMDGIPDDFEFGELPEDWDHFMPFLEDAMRRIPALERTGIRKFFCGPESFTPDDRYLLGEAPELAGFFVACGFNSIGIQSAGGAGKVLAEWIADGHPPMDLADVDIRRMQPFQSNARYLRERVTEGLGLLYAMHWPHRQYATARPARTSPLHERLRARGACFAEAAGWERPGWFAPAGVAPDYDYAYRRAAWFAHWASEHRAVRERVGLFDLSSFGKFLVQGRDAEAVLQRVCANEVAVAPGRIVYTPWLNERGGIEADLTVTRLAEDAYLVVTSPASQNRDLHWLKRHISEDARAFATDVTSGYAVLALMGPESRALLAPLTPADLSNEAFPYGTSQVIELGYALVRAQRISYVGELGLELYIPSEFALPVFDLIAEAAGDRLAFAGFHALDSLRLEKAYRHWGHDITDEDTPFEAGLGFACAFDKPAPFIGRDAVLRQRERTPTKRLAQFKLRDPEPLLFRDEPIVMDGVRIGLLTSGSYGHTLGAAIGMGWVRHPDGVTPDLLGSACFELEIAGERYPAQASLRAFYDPRGERLRA